MLRNSCNTGTRGLPDMSTLSPRAHGPQASGIHIRQITHACVTTVTCVIMAESTRESTKNDYHLTFAVQQTVSVKTANMILCLVSIYNHE